MGIRILLAEDQPLMRRGLRTVLDYEAGMDVVGEAANGEDALDAARRLAPDVVLMDIQMPGMGGVEATRRIIAANPTARVLILTTFDTEDNVLDGVRAGAAGYLLKDVDAAELCEIIRRVARGERFIQPGVAARYLRALADRRDAPAEEPLSPRELDVLGQLAHAATNKDIAAALGIAESTVKNHVNSILGKLQVKNRTEAALKAQKLLNSD